MHGLLIVDKPPAITSTDVLRILARRLSLRKLGHGGTLDPFATGVLPVLIGQATRLLPYLQGQEKVYRATLQLGTATDTLDLDGRIVEERPVPAGWCPDRVRGEVLARLVGEPELTVPAYAAVRVEGERLYRRSRRGEQVVRPVRRMSIHELELEGYEAGSTLTLRVLCGSGTYIRSLAEAIGGMMGTVAHLVALRRLAVGPFDVTRAVRLDDIDGPLRARQLLVPPALVLPRLEVVMLDEQEQVRVRQGRLLPGTRVPLAAEAGSLLRLLDDRGELAAVGEVLPDRAGIRVARGFPDSEQGEGPDGPGPRPDFS